MSVMSSPFIITAILVGSTCCYCGACWFVWFDVVVCFAMYFRIEFLFCRCFGLVFFVLFVFFGVFATSSCCLLFGLVVGLLVVVVCCVCSRFSLFLSFFLWFEVASDVVVAFLVVSGLCWFWF